jgi:hypothetical protein
MAGRLKRWLGLADTWPRPKPVKVHLPDKAETATLEAFEERCETCGAPFGCCTLDCPSYHNPDDPDWLEQERRRLWADNGGD